MTNVPEYLNPGKWAEVLGAYLSIYSFHNFTNIRRLDRHVRRVSEVPNRGAKGPDFFFQIRTRSCSLIGFTRINNVHSVNLRRNTDIVAH